MGVIAAGVAIYFMEAHKVIKKLWTSLGLDVRPSSPRLALQAQQAQDETGKSVYLWGMASHRPAWRRRGRRAALDAPGPAPEPLVLPSGWAHASSAGPTGKDSALWPDCPCGASGHSSPPSHLSLNPEPLATLPQEHKMRSVARLSLWRQQSLITALPPGFQP